MTDKEKLEMMNLRNRVRAQREEIKRLQAEVNRLLDVIEKKLGGDDDSDVMEALFPETLEDLEKMLNAVGVRQ